MDWLDCSSTIDVSLTNDGSLIDDVNFLTLQRDGNWIEQDIKSYQFYIKTGEEEYPVDDYEYSCINDDKKVPSCSKIKTGSHKEVREIWEEYNLGDEVVAGDYKVKLEGEKEASRTVDWQIKTQGKWIEEWAVWGVGAIASELRGYWDMDELSGTVAVDKVGVNNATLTNMAFNPNGLINGAGNNTNVGNPSFISNYKPSNADKDITFNFWFNTSNMDVRQVICFITDFACGTPDSNGDFRAYVSGNALQSDWYDGSARKQADTPALNIGEWNMITFVINQTAVTGYANGVAGTPSAATTFTWTGNDIFAPWNLDGLWTTPTYLDEVGIWNRSLTQTEITELYNSGIGLAYPFGGEGITLNAPEDTLSSPTQTIEFNATATQTGATITNMSLWTNQSGTFQLENATTGLSGNSNTTIWNHNLGSDGTYLWGVEACDSDGDCTNSNNRTVSIDTAEPSITINEPTSLIDYSYVNKTQTLNWSVVDTSLDSMWYNYNGTNITVLGAANATTFVIKNSTNNNLTFYANDTFGNENSTFVNWTYKIFENSKIFNSTSTEGTSETFQINVTANSSLSAVDLVYNGTTYATTQSGEVWTRSLTVPAGTTFNEFYWNFTYGSEYLQSATYNQTISSNIFAPCNVTNNVTFLNISFKDEGNLSGITASIPTSTFNYWLDDASVNKSFTYINNADQFSFAFCGTPSDKTFNVDPYVQYKQGTSYPQRTYDTSAVAFTNTTTDVTLYLLSSLDGQYVTFQVLDALSSVMEGVVITGNRTLEGSSVTVAKGTTDASGSVTFWLNPDFSHSFSFVKSGYDTLTESLTPTQSSYTVTLGGGIASPDIKDYTRQIGLAIVPAGDYLTNQTTYSFNYSLTTSYWTFDSWGFGLKYGNGTAIGSQSSTVDTGGLLTLSASTSAADRIIMDYYYVINSTTQNMTKVWQINTPGNFGIQTFFDRTIVYIDANLFGILGSSGTDYFGKALISVLVLVLVTGGLSMRYGIASENVLMGVIFGLVMLLNSLSFIPNPEFLTGSGVNLGDFLVYLTGLFVLTSIIKEERR